MRTRCFELDGLDEEDEKAPAAAPDVWLGRFGRPSASTRGGCRVDEASGCAQEP